jgi:hypothetical protein
VGEDDAGLEEVRVGDVGEGDAGLEEARVGDVGEEEADNIDQQVGDVEGDEVDEASKRETNLPKFVLSLKITEKRRPHLVATQRTTYIEGSKPR